MFRNLAIGTKLLASKWPSLRFDGWLNCLRLGLSNILRDFVGNIQAVNDSKI